jgi:hypothetical protein
MVWYSRQSFSRRWHLRMREGASSRRFQGRDRSDSASRVCGLGEERIPEIDAVLSWFGAPFSNAVQREFDVRSMLALGISAVVSNTMSGLQNPRDSL